VLQPRTRVVLRIDPSKGGTVAYERSGFVLVHWDSGDTSLIWGADLWVRHTG